MKCEDVRDALSLHLYGELSFHQEEILEQHLASCPACRQELERESALHAAVDTARPEPPATLLAHCRRQLMATVRSQSEARRASFLDITRLLAWLAPRRAWLRPAGAVAMLGLGFLLARLTVAPTPGGVSLRGSSPDLSASRVRFVEPEPGGRIRILLDETRQRVIRGTLDDSRIRQLLLAAAQDPNDAGLRVESLDLLKAGSGAEEIRRALLQAVSRDPNPGVRLKAIEGLADYAGDPEVRHTLAEVLLKDDNPGIRTQAIDLLIQHKRRDLVGVLQELMRHEDNDYIRLRTQRALREMNASVETF